ncbi:MAG: hypothetical protein ACI9OJ_005383, partial [Myxococcota bacterium]
MSQWVTVRANRLPWTIVTRQAVVDSVIFSTNGVQRRANLSPHEVGRATISFGVSEPLSGIRTLRAPSD